MRVLENYDLTTLNTLGVSARTKYFMVLTHESELPELFASEYFTNNPKFFLGGGSNILFTKDFQGIVILNALKGIQILKEDSESVTIRSMAGEIWHDLVDYAILKGNWGIENLSLIPGTVGAAPMQNIGAYGAELKDVLENVEAVEIAGGARKSFTKEECRLGYRDSIFKNELKGKYCITAVTIKLSKIEKKNMSFKSLRDYLDEHDIDIKTPKDISDAVTAIRRSKLPDPAVIGNAGSFFKNVFLEKDSALEFLAKYPEAPHFEEDEVTKIPAAWLIEQCGPANGTSWKGYRVGNVGVHEKQALVLVNYGNAIGQELKELAEEIIDSVFKKFGLKLVPEVNLI